MKITEFIKENIVVLDGAMGTMLHAAGLEAGELPELWNITHPQEVIEIHKAYFDAGSNVVSTNTFGANSLKFEHETLKEIIVRAVENCKAAKCASCSAKEKFIAFDIGPLGKLLKPYGELEFDDAVSVFAESVKIAAECDIDLFFIETMNDSYETKAALLAVKENSDLPVFVSNAYSEDGKLLTGASPSVMACMLESMGADAIGANCSFGPDKTLEIIKELTCSVSIPVIMKPNAGLPEFVDGHTVYSLSPDEFADSIEKSIEYGVVAVGGCCGTSPEYISALCRVIRDKNPIKKEVSRRTVISSYTHTVEIGSEKPVLIGERINPTGKKRFKQALMENDIDYILSEGINQQEKGVDILDVNVGLAGIDEVKMLHNVVACLQSVSNLPLQLDSTDVKALEAAMRIYNGKPLVNSVNGKQSSMDSVFPLIKKYGGCVIALTLDENGIPDNADGRISIALKIINEAKKYNIDSSDIIFDPLAMTVSTDENSALKTLECIEKLNRMGYRTSLGVSNISFGLPQRDIINSTFFTLALSKGLDAAIMNPYSKPMMDSYYSFCALNAKDKGFESYIPYASEYAHVSPASTDVSSEETLALLIEKGRAEAASKLTSKLIETDAAMNIINNQIIPALDICGRNFEDGKIFLPQLLMSAEAASAAFSAIKEKSVGSSSDKATVVIATVKGDIHDIGKNIVKLLLENYGFNVVDLGKDVCVDSVVDAVIQCNAPVVCLSALMTTTLPSMEATVNALRQKAQFCRIIVGGAVVTAEYAEKINADAYAKDAMEAVRCCERFTASDLS